jgi:hypothetical protein
MAGDDRNLAAAHGQVPVAAGPSGSSTTGIDLSAPLVQYGAVGLLALAAMFWAWTLYKQAIEGQKRERERADRLEAEVQRLNTDIHDKYIPILTRTTDALQQFLYRGGRRDDP